LSWDDAAEWVSKAALPLLVAHGPGEDVRSWLARSEQAGNGWALLVGNEGEGPRQEAFTRADALLSIPLVEGVESLNAAMAGAILLWALGPGRVRI
jgi:TrmH family RNA methyltransferase